MAFILCLSSTLFTWTYTYALRAFPQLFYRQTWRYLGLSVCVNLWTSGSQSRAVVVHREVTFGLRRPSLCRLPQSLCVWRKEENRAVAAPAFSSGLCVCSGQFLLLITTWTQPALSQLHTEVPEVILWQISLDCFLVCHCWVVSYSESWGWDLYVCKCLTI